MDDVIGKGGTDEGDQALDLGLALKAARDDAADAFARIGVESLDDIDQQRIGVAVLLDEGDDVVDLTRGNGQNEYVTTG